MEMGFRLILDSVLTFFKINNYLVFIKKTLILQLSFSIFNPFHWSLGLVGALLA